MLKRQVDVLADLLAFRHRRQRLVVYRRRVEVQQPDPLEAVDRVQVAQEPRERAALAAIDAVEGGVLRDQQQLLDAARRERARLADDRLRRTASIRAAQRRDDAEGALVVAALGDLDVGVMPRRREQTRRVRVVDVGRARLRRGRRGLGIGDWGLVGAHEVQRPRFRPARSARDRADNLRHLAGAEHGVDLRDLLLQLIAIALRHAAGDDEPPAGAVFLVLGHFENRVDRLLLRRIDECARVDDDHVGVRRILRQLVPRPLREPEHHFGVDEVFRTTEGDEANLHGYSRYSILGYGIVSRTCSSLQIHDTTRSIPMPKPPCGTVP